MFKNFFKFYPGEDFQGNASMDTFTSNLKTILLESYN